MWQAEHRIETSASPEIIWRIFRDVPGWKNWNAGIEKIEMHGPFAVGTEFLMTPPGQTTLVSKLVEVRDNEAFTDETIVGDVTVYVAHRIRRLTATRSEIVYSITVSGPDAAEVGKLVSADFPDVLKSLVKLAESQQ